MNNYGYGRGGGYYSPDELGVRPAAQLSAGFLTQAFTWMFAGLLLSAFVGFLVQASASMQQTAANLFLPALIGEFALVFVISLGINRLSATLALGLFFVYAALNGLTLGLIVLAYRYSIGDASVGAAFLTTSLMFGGAAMYGMVTKRSLATMGGYLTMALFGLLAAMLVNFFLGSALISYVISVVGVVVFTGLTAWDTQRISQGQIAAGLGSMEKGAVIGALILYLDFINLFLMLLRLFGGTERR